MEAILYVLSVTNHYFLMAFIIMRPYEKENAQSAGWKSVFLYNIQLPCCNPLGVYKATLTE